MKNTKAFTLVEIIVVMFIVGLLTLLGVSTSNRLRKNGPREERAEFVDHTTPHIIRIGKCEYVEVGSYYGVNYAITHKGDCDNPIHRNAK